MSRIQYLSHQLEDEASSCRACPLWASELREIALLLKAQASEIETLRVGYTRALARAEAAEKLGATA
jgi:hypothetical protein